MRHYPVLLIALWIAAAVMAAEVVTRDVAREADIKSSITDFSVEKAAFAAEAKKVLTEHVIPLLKKAEALKQQGTSIRVSLSDYMTISKADTEQADIIFKVVDSQIDANSIDENERMIDLLKIITVIVIEDITHEKITDPELALPVTVEP